VIRGDPIQWIHDLVYGRDTLEVSPQIAIGIVMTHGDYPREDDDPKVWSGYPIHGVTDDCYQHIHWQQVMEGYAPQLSDGRVERTRVIVTAGQYPLVVTGSGDSVQEAMYAAYDVAWQVNWPSGVMFRTDIGKRLEADLPKLQRFGYAMGVEF
jgi:phosphoribosylamine--glycine ligase